MSAPDAAAAVEVALAVVFALGWIAGVLTAVIFRWGRR